MADISKITNGGTTYDVKDGLTRETVTNAVSNHGIGTVYREQVMAPVTINPEDWNENGNVFLPDVVLELTEGDTYVFTINGVENVSHAFDAGDGVMIVEAYGDEYSGAIVTNIPGEIGTLIAIYYETPSSPMVFSLEHLTINKIDPSLIDMEEEQYPGWDVVVFFDLDNQNGTLLKGNAAALFEKILSSEVNVSTLAIGLVADTNVQDRWHYVTLNTSYMTDPFLGSLWLETSSSDFQVPYMTWGWDLDTNEIYPD